MPSGGASERSQERQQALPLLRRQLQESPPRQLAFARCRRMASSIVAALPSCRSGRRNRRPQSAGVRISSGSAAACGMPSPVPMSCSSRSEKSGTGLRLKSGFALGPVVSAGTWQAAQPIAREDLLAARGRCRRSAPRADRREKAHEALEVVDAAPPRARVARCLRDRACGSQRRICSAVTPNASSCGKQIVGDAHLVAIGVGAERQQRGVLRLPAEAADAPLAGRDVGDDGRAAADAVAVAVERILEREQRVVGDGFDQAGAEERNRHAARDDVGVGGNDGWHACAAPRTGGTASRPTRRARRTRPCVVADAGARPRAIAPLPPMAGTLWHAAQLVAVERRAQALLRGLDLEEVVEPEAELLELARRDARQRIAGLRAARCCAGDRGAGSATADARAERAGAAERLASPRLPRGALFRRTIMTPRMKRGPRRTAASTRTCSGPASGVERHGRLTSPALRESRR